MSQHGKRYRQARAAIDRELAGPVLASSPAHSLVKRLREAF